MHVHDDVVLVDVLRLHVLVNADVRGRNEEVAFVPFGHLVTQRHGGGKMPSLSRTAAEEVVRVDVILFELLLEPDETVLLADCCHCLSLSPLCCVGGWGVFGL